MTAAPERREWRVTGHVQGVGYRWFVVRQSQRLGLAGWARNLSDGSVEVVAGGAPTLLDALAKELAVGPPHARVESVHEQGRGPASSLPLPFEVR
ncbi:MAG: acylphosphatase [Gemmatimonadaceae bacterium]|nr:acylphosphatase [Gemmatimonadaceae bacterium]